MMTPFDDFVYLINHVLLGEEPTIEDFILLVGTLVAFIAFILWCCFPIQPKEPGPHRQFTCKIIQNPIKAFDASTSTDDAPANAGAAGGAGAGAAAGTGATAAAGAGAAAAGGSSSSSSNLQYNGSGSGSSGSASGGSGSGSYSKNGTVAMHNYYVKNGHHCCT